METYRKCQLAVCECRARAENLYCSEYCEQAATQAIPRDFCQCNHAVCEQPMAVPGQTGTGLDLPATVSCDPGRLTIEYASADDLRRQLQWLAQVLDWRPDVLAVPDGATQRRNPASEQGKRAAAQSA